MYDTDEEEEPEGRLRGENVDEDVVGDVEHGQDLHRGVPILRLNRLPVDAEEEIHEAHARLQEDQKEPA